MQEKYASLSRATLCFPLALVLFEFSVYIGNDMIQPGMLAVVAEFGVDSGWVPSSLTAYLVGGAMLQWLLGPLSDRVGRRPVMLAGVAFFVLSCVATFFSRSIESFMLLRVLQGMGLCFITAIAYASVQEAFEEAAAVKVTALMANVALIAPLVGPLAGAALIAHWPWRVMFGLIAACAFVSWLGLIRTMPETVVKPAGRLSVAGVAGDYRALLKNRRFVAAALVLPLMSLPLLGWIALSPVMLMEGAAMSPTGYGLAQLPVFGALIAGNLTLVRLTDKVPLGRSVVYGQAFLLAGVATMVATSWLPPLAAGLGLMAGVSLMCFGEGLSFAVLYRFALTASDVSKGTIAATIGMLSMSVYAVGIEAFKHGYFAVGPFGYAALSLVCTLLFWRLSRRVVASAMRERADGALAALRA
ncbi:DHA1 family multidrug/chloramphenicol efflux transport protein-like MFS transporter [Crenobacter luteus]|uniref:MFS transporter n=1 Tax=Crenobacter luteus TaxID=1452487 RepID=UPI00104EFCC7|nr:MFS transporter [Crenobacter luteus]TCP10663.1 DHA1 family multidrug/chloramphenicol efflux transport protein-like MFS transporter [Crenobacter luteus]